MTGKQPLQWIDWVKCFTSHPTQNRSFWRFSSQPISWLSTEKLKQKQWSKHASITKYNTTKQTQKKLKPGLVASYDLRPGNGEGLFWFRCFINLSLTYLLRHLSTYLQPRNPHGVPLSITVERPESQLQVLITSWHCKCYIITVNWRMSWWWNARRIRSTMTRPTFSRMRRATISDSLLSLSLDGLLMISFTYLQQQVLCTVWFQSWIFSSLSFSIFPFPLSSTELNSIG